MRSLFLCFFVLFLPNYPCLAASIAMPRSIFLNGIDISSAKNQVMSGVTVRIDSRGSIYIEAPQYEVQQESTFLPLSRQTPPHPQIPVHRAPGSLPNTVTPEDPKQGLALPVDSGDTMGQAEAEKPKPIQAESALLEKEGTRINPNAAAGEAIPQPAIPKNP